MNNLTLENIYPKYFTPKDLEQSQVWGKKNVFNKEDKILVIAPSGSGKSTMATAMLGNHFQYEGIIKYDHNTLQNLNLEQIVSYRKEGINLLFQDVRLIKDYTVSENILLRTFGDNSKNNISSMREYASVLGIENILSKKASNCSYGERQRAAIVRSLINPTNFLIYDECFSHLDLDNKEKAYSLINRVAVDNKSAVIFFELNNFPFNHQYQILYL